LKKIAAFALITSALFFAAGLAACSGGGSDDKRDGGATATPADGGDDTTPAEQTPTDGGDDGGLDSLDAEEYFRALEQIGIRTDADLEAISQEISSAVFTTDQEEIDGVRDALQRTGMVLEQALLDLEGLEPPDEIDSEHATFRDTLLDVTILTAGVLEDTAAATTSAELNATLDGYDPQLTAADNAFDDACFALQGIADDNGFNVDIQCGDS
jgi:hypothetical protein